MRKTFSIIVASTLGLGLAGSPAFVTAAAAAPTPRVQVRQRSYDAIAGSYLVPANAVRQVAKLRAKGFTGFGVAVRKSRGKTWNVVVQTFTNKADATALVARLTQVGVASYVLTR